MDNNQPVQPKQPQQEPKKRRGNKIGGLIVLTLGVIFLLQNFYPQIGSKLILPAILIIVGIGILYSSFRK